MTPIQVTPGRHRKRDDKGRPTGTSKVRRGRKRLKPDGTIEGGEPLPSGAPLSNVSRSNTRHRVFGKKLLRA